VGGIILSSIQMGRGSQVLSSEFLQYPAAPSNLHLGADMGYFYVQSAYVQPLPIGAKIGA
jgi:hypothetical protein